MTFEIREMDGGPIPQRSAMSAREVMTMILSTHQKFIMDTLRKLGCIRQRQLLILVRERFRQADLEITQARMAAMLRQLRVGTANLHMDDELVWLSNQQL